MTANPCITEICDPGLVWGLNVDTAVFIITKESHWIEDAPLVIYDCDYLDGDSIELYGQLSISQDWDGNNYYEFEIVDKELRDTVINSDNFLTLIFELSSFECGIYIFEHPKHYSTSELTYDRHDTATYIYSPIQDFTGVDTVIFVTFCAGSPDNMYFSVIEYIILVTEETKINSMINKIFTIYPNSSSGEIHITLDNVQDYWFTINNLQGQMILDGRLKQDLTITLRQGLYLISIFDNSKVIYRQKIIVDK